MAVKRNPDEQPPRRPRIKGRPNPEDGNSANENQEGAPPSDDDTTDENELGDDLFGSDPFGEFVPDSSSNQLDVSTQPPIDEPEPFAVSELGEIASSVGPTDEPPVEINYPSNSPESADVVEIPWDENTSYFFMFGVKGAGKSVILSGLFYNILAHREGDDLRNKNDHEIEHQDRGTKLINNLLEQVPDGSWPSSTPTLNSESQQVPRQMNMEFLPRDPKKPEFDFCTMDMSGEDLMKLRPGSDYDKARLNDGIEAFLDLPFQNLAFLCVYPAYSSVDNAQRLSSYMQSFLDELDRTGHSDTPLLMIVSKWDLVEDGFESPAEFLRQKAPIIYNKLLKPTRTIMSFSIGNVDEAKDIYDYDPTSSNKLFGWMYKTQMGLELDEPISKSLWQKLLSRLQRSGDE